MAVLVEAISVVMLRDSIEKKYPGGWNGFADDCPNNTLCADDKIARVGFMSPDDVSTFIKDMETLGFTYLSGGRSVEIAVVDQLKGFAAPCDWLEAGKVELDNGKCSVTACRLKGCTVEEIIVPHGWEYEKSLSSSFGFVPLEHHGKSLEFIRRENNMDVYLNLLTGKEVYVGRTSKSSGRTSARNKSTKE